MRILITVQTYYPRKDGVQTVTQYLAEGLAQKKHQVTVITKRHQNDKIEENINNVLVKRIDLSTKAGLYFGNKKSYLKLIKDESEKNDLLINVCTQNAFTDLILDKLDTLNVKKMLYIHGMYDFNIHKYDFKNAKNLLLKIWKNIRWYLFYKKNKKNFYKYDKVINIHEMVNGTEFFQNKYNINPVIIENAANDKFFDEIITKKKRIICVANYSDDKNQKFILNAFYKSKEARIYELIFIGSRDNKYLNELKKMKMHLDKEYEEKNVKFLTNIEREETIEYIKQSEIYLFGSKHEMFPLSIVEAMASKTPYISTNIGCVRNLPGGFIVQNVEEMAYMLDVLCKDEDLRNQLGQIGFDYAQKHFRIKNKIEDINNLIRILLEEKNGN